MAQTVAHLVDHGIPHVPVRQWVLSLPIPLHLLLAAQPKLLKRVFALDLEHCPNCGGELKIIVGTG